MGFRLTAKLPLSVTKPNCRRSLTFILYFQLVFAFWLLSNKIQNDKHCFFVTLVIYLHIDISKTCHADQ